MHTSILLLAMAWAVATATSSAPGDTVAKPNHGVVFRPLPQRVLAERSTYDIIFTVPRPDSLPTDLPTCQNPLPRLKFRPEDAPSTWCRIFNPRELELVSALLSYIRGAQDGIAALLHSPLATNTTRETRAPILGFVGSVSRTLFGTATVDDVRRLAAIINNVVVNVNQQGDATHRTRLLHVAVNITADKLHTATEQLSTNIH